MSQKIKVGDFVKHKSADIYGTVVRIEPICESSETLIAEIKMPFCREIANIKNLSVIDRGSMRWRKA